MCSGMAVVQYVQVWSYVDTRWEGVTCTPKGYVGPHSGSTCDVAPHLRGDVKELSSTVLCVSSLLIQRMSEQCRLGMHGIGHAVGFIIAISQTRYDRNTAM
jgi:hypothetical protein